MRWLAVAVVGAMLAVGGCAGEATDTAETTETTGTTGTTELRRVAPLGPDRWSITYVDVTGTDRTVSVELRRPARSAPRPAVVLWSHGGSTGKTSSQRVGRGWGEAINDHGHAFVAIAHPARSSWDELCEAIGATECGELNPLAWDRPHDVTAVIDWMQSTDQLTGVDVDRIVYGGHSAGGLGVLSTAGMRWPLPSNSAPPADPRPIGFIVASPPGADARGLDDESFSELDRPVLLLSGDGDTTQGTEAADRRRMLDLLPNGSDAVTVWLGDTAARHTTFNLDVRACRRAGGGQRHCNSLTRTLGRVGAEFVDRVTAGTFDRDAFARRVGAALPDAATVITPP